MKKYIQTWDDIKNIKGVWGPYIEDSNEYHLNKIDGNINYKYDLLVSDWDQQGTDTKDFYDNIKPKIDNNDYVFDPRSDDCVPTVYQTTRPVTVEGYTTYFAGAGDDLVNGIGQGERLSFELTDQDSVIQKDITFNEDVYIKDGYFMCENAPFSSYFDVELIHPLDGLIGVFCKKCPLLGTFHMPLNTEDRALIPQGIILRINVYNAQVKSNFKMTASLELFRKHTV